MEHTAPHWYTCYPALDFLTPMLLETLEAPPRH
uniref:Uncharacterized protein n=1 Tax=Setaria italica TaxID=4555 RepID=K4AND3_SETIT